MPQTLPRYVRPPIREIILSRFPRGMRDLANEMAIPYTTVIHAFKNNQHTSLRAWLELSAALKLQPEELARILYMDDENDRRDVLLWLTGSESIYGLICSTGIDSGYLYGILRGQSARKIRDVYLPMSRKLGISLEALSEGFRAA